jgi:hypothetical protein
VSQSVSKGSSEHLYCAGCGGADSGLAAGASGFGGRLRAEDVRPAYGEREALLERIVEHKLAECASAVLFD